MPECLWKDALRKWIAEGMIRSDSDIEDFAEEHGVDVGVVDREVHRILSENTPCFGCRHVSFMFSGLYPCNACLRNERISDRFESL